MDQKMLAATSPKKISRKGLIERSSFLSCANRFTATTTPAPSRDNQITLLSAVPSVGMTTASVAYLAGGSRIVLGTMLNITNAQSTSVTKRAGFRRREA